MASRKDYEAIVKIIQNTSKLPNPNGAIRPNNANCSHIAHRLADYFEQDNPKFDRSRFLKACGLE